MTDDIQKEIDKFNILLKLSGINDRLVMYRPYGSARPAPRGWGGQWNSRVTPQSFGSTYLNEKKIDEFKQGFRTKKNRRGCEVERKFWIGSGTVSVYSSGLRYLTSIDDISFFNEKYDLGINIEDYVFSKSQSYATMEEVKKRIEKMIE